MYLWVHFFCIDLKSSLSLKHSMDGLPIITRGRAKYRPSQSRGWDYANLLCVEFLGSRSEVGCGKGILKRKGLKDMAWSCSWEPHFPTIWIMKIQRTRWEFWNEETEEPHWPCSSFFTRVGNFFGWRKETLSKIPLFFLFSKLLFSSFFLTNQSEISDAQRWVLPIENLDCPNAFSSMERGQILL